MKDIAILLLAGSSTRIKREREKKQFIKIDGKEMFLYPLFSFLKAEFFSKIILVISKGDEDRVISILKRESLIERVSIIYGGKSRAESVYNALNSIDEECHIYIHDACRLNLPISILEKEREELERFDAVTCYKKCKDSVILKDSYVDRDDIKLIQTPQAFLLSEIKDAIIKEIRCSDMMYTDEYQLALKYGIKATLIQADNRLDKITDDDDLSLAFSLLNLS